LGGLIVKRLLGILLIAVLLLALAACNLRTTAPEASPAPVEDNAAVPKTTPIPVEESTVPEAEPEDAGPALVFSTTDRDGKTWDESSLSDYSLIMINFWEPWCPPCVGEMPDLAKLSAAYAEQGLLILGIYSTEDMEADVDDVLAKSGTNYPILHYVEAFDRFQSGYVPTTVFLNAAGETVGESYVGSRSYEDWAKIVEGLL
jgi:thiol-disulfide isomerase/thioredoxin